MEVGAGYGRVISYLLDHSFSGKITAIERCNTSFNYLKNQFSHHTNVKLVQGDIHDCDKITEKFDLILFLWSGLADFSQSEQPNIIKTLSLLLKKNGVLIIDTMPADTIPLNMKQLSKQSNYVLNIRNAIVYTYSASLKEINKYASLSGFTDVKHVLYLTETARKRYLHIFI